MAAGDVVARREPPLFLPLLASIAACGLLSGAWGVMVGGELAGLVFGVMLGGALGAAHALLLGAPFAYWLRRSKRFDALHMMVGGFFIGALPLSVASLLTLPIELFLSAGVIGMLSALVFLATYRCLHRRD